MISWICKIEKEKQLELKKWRVNDKRRIIDKMTRRGINNERKKRGGVNDERKGHKEKVG